MPPIRPSIRASTASSMSTMTQTEVVPLPQQPVVNTSGTLRLRGEPARRQGIRWAADVIDNEGLGRKKSKVCCIYHKSREVGESSSEDDSSDSSSSSGDDSGSDSEQDNSRARMGGRGRQRLEHHHSHDHHHINGSGEGRGRVSMAPKSKRKTSPNAYEKMSKGGGTKVVK